jgi:hypothetical protein
MPYDIDYREEDVTALNTLTNLVNKGGAAPGNFQVPGNASRITEIRISASGDYTADAMYSLTSTVHLGGAGLKNGGFQNWIGPCGGTCGAGGTTAGANIGKVQIYPVNIPVVPGGEIDADAYIFGEDCGSVRVGCWLVYDGPVVGRISDMDTREHDLTDANTEVRLVNRNGVAENSFRTTGRTIGEVHVNGGIKAVAGPLACLTNVQLRGAGFEFAGNYDFAGHSYSTQDDIAVSGDSCHTTTVKHETMIKTKPGNLFDAYGTMIEDDVGTIHCIVGIGYL